MGLYESSREFPLAVPDLDPIAYDVMHYFEQRGYTAHGSQTDAPGWEISVYKTGVFRVVLGMQTALKITLEATDTVTRARATIGIDGFSALPDMLASFLLWPVTVLEVWAMAQQAKLDEGAFNCIEASLKAHTTLASTAAGRTTTAGASHSFFCTSCGTALPEQAKFCLECGTRMG